MAAGDPGTLKRNYTAIAVETELSSSISASTQGGTTTSFIVLSNSGFPSTYPFTLIVDPDTSKEEVVTVNSGTGTTYSVTRGQDNTQAVAHSAGVVVRHGVSAREFKELQTHIAARGYDVDSGIMANVDSHVHGIATGDGVVVGTLKEQTLTRKTLTTPTINGATISGAFTSTATITGGTVTAATVTSSTIRTSTFTSGTVTSSTLVSTTLGSDLSGGTSYKITNLADPASNQDAATKKYVDDKVAALVASAPSTLDTLDEIAAALGDDPNYATTITTALGTKLALSGGTMTGAIAMGNNKITGTYTPSAGSDLTTKTYIDNLYGDTASAALSASSASASATAAANSASASATSASASASSATASANSASAAASSATASANSASAAATSATDAATSATNASNSASAAATSATNAATSETNAAASASAASGSATASANSATASATSATASATSASASASSATAAAGSATSAANSATAAAGSATSASASATLAQDWASKTTGTVDGSEYSAKYWALQSNSANAVIKTDFNAKGDILVATADNAYTALSPASTNGYVLTVDSTTATGLKWIAPSTADITTVTAGTGLSGGGTSGDVTVSLDTSSVYVVPSQSGNSGKYLTTNGTTSSWGTIDLSAYATVTSVNNLTTTENDNTILALMGAY